MLAFKHTTGIHIQHTRGIILRIVFDTHLLVVISDCLSTKHRVTLFHYVVSNPKLRPPQWGIIIYGLYTGANIRNNIECCIVLSCLFCKSCMFFLISDQKQANLMLLLRYYPTLFGCFRNNSYLCSVIPRSPCPKDKLRG